MSNESGGPGGCLVTILVILVLGAVFGLVDWSTVRNYGTFLAAFFILGIVLILGFIIWGFLSKNK